MRAAVAVDASGGFAVAILNGLGVETTIVDRLLVGVASGAGDLCRSSVVGRAFQIGVAIHAGKHATVNGRLEGFRIHVKANALSVDFLVEGRVAVAGQTFVAAGFWDRP